jgi:glycosyl transferase family 25
LKYKNIPLEAVYRPIKISKIDDWLDVIYINLAHRIDRKKDLVIEFSKIGLANYKRFDAVQKSNGALGCANSHRDSLKYYLDIEKLLMICEDDISFIGSCDTIMILLEGFINDSNLDVLCLGFNHSNQYSYNHYFFLTSDTQTMSCYVLKPHMKEIMLNNFDLSVQLLEYGIDKIYRPEIDQVWKSLQKDYNFVIPKIRFAYQRESFSDIEMKIVDYKL